jgi:Zn-dependent protease
MATKVSGRRFALASPTTAAILGAIALVLLIASLPLSSLSHQLTFNDTSGGVGFTLFFGGVGVVVARRQPRNPIGGC